MSDLPDIQFAHIELKASKGKQGRSYFLADTLDEAVAKACPILKIGGLVEVRKVVTPDDNS